MAKQERQVVSRRGPKEESPTESARSGAQERGAKLREELDDLIDEIDEVLEENAEEFVNNYVQYGGE